MSKKIRKIVHLKKKAPESTEDDDGDNVADDPTAADDGSPDTVQSDPPIIQVVTSGDLATPALVA